MKEFNVKQVIVIRKDLNMRKGKIGSQTAHASLASVLDQMIKVDHPYDGKTIKKFLQCKVVLKDVKNLTPE